MPPSLPRLLHLHPVLLTAALVAASCSGDDTPGPIDSTTTAASTTTTSMITTTAPPDTTTTGPPRPTVPVPVHLDENGFNDHTVPSVASVDGWFVLSRANADRAVTKFTISDFRTTDAAVRWADSNFFELHDEWYWYRLLNGEPVPGVSDRPVSGLELDSVGDVYDWAEKQGSLPLNLRWIDSQTFGRNRLHSPRFYEIILHSEPRLYGAGSVVHVPEGDDTPERWLIELEYSDDVTADEVARYFELLAPSLPPEIGDNLEWVLRSPDQEDTAERMIADGAPYSDRIVRWADVVPPGALEVHNPGIAAGKLLLVYADGSQLARATDTDIIVMEHVPDYLPPGSALLTSAPQTPLAHVNLLARNRGIPNMSLSGITDNPAIQQAARIRAPVIVRAEGHELDITIITDDELNDWQARNTQSVVRVPAVDPDAMPLTVDLTDLAASIDSEDDLDPWRPIIGGKSAGFVPLLNAPGVTTPPTPLAVTVGPYLEHLEQVDDALAAMLVDREFTSDPRTRFLFLEGPSDFEAFYSAERDLGYGFSIIADHPPGTLLGDVPAADGFKHYFRDAPMDPATLVELTDALEDRFGHYEPTQGAEIPVVELGGGHRGLQRRGAVRLQHRVPRRGGPARHERPQEDG